MAAAGCVLFYPAAGARSYSYFLAALFVLASFFIMLVLLHYSTVISKLSEQNTILAQRLAILENRLREGEPGPD